MYVLDLLQDQFKSIRDFLIKENILINVDEVLINQNVLIIHQKEIVSKERVHDNDPRYDTANARLQAALWTNKSIKSKIREMEDEIDNMSKFDKILRASYIRELEDQIDTLHSQLISIPMITHKDSRFMGTIPEEIYDIVEDEWIPREIVTWKSFVAVPDRIIALNCKTGHEVQIEDFPNDTSNIPHISINTYLRDLIPFNVEVKDIDGLNKTLSHHGSKAKLFVGDYEGTVEDVIVGLA